MRSHAAVRFAARFTVVAKLLSQLLGLLALLTGVPAVVSLTAGAYQTTLAYIAVMVVFAAVYRLGRGLPEPSIVQSNEALVTVAVLFVVSSLAMSVPMTTYGIPFMDAWFEAVSGITTTGLSVVSLQDKPWSFLFARGWLQWVGGVGVVVLALALFVSPGTAGRQLGFSDREVGNTVGGTRAHAKRVIYIYIALSALGIVLFLIAGAHPLDAVVHSMTSVSTGGFANAESSLAGLGGAQVIVANVLCLAGAVSFHVYYLTLVWSPRERILDSQLYGLMAVVLVVFLACGVAIQMRDENISLFQLAQMIISAQTTAGFSSVDTASLPAWLLLVLCACMFVGGGLGSTSGGIKIARLAAILRQARLHLIRSSMSARVVMPKRDRELVEIREVLAVVAWFVICLGVSWLLFVLHGHAPLQSLFEVVSALSTAGLSVGLVTPDLPATLKIVLCFNMLLGRVEVVALLLIFLPGTWIGRRRRIS